MNTMIPTSLLLSAAVAATMSASISAQQFSQSFDLDSPDAYTADDAARLALSDPDIFRAPIHDEPAIEGRAGGTWATGASYKVSFHDGMRFFPVLGSSYPQNLPLAWKTTSVTSGGVELLADGERPVTWRDDWRFEYRYGAVTEAYDVRRDGVEQTFVLHRRPQTLGDLVVRGRVETPLHCESAGSSHRRLEFTDEEGRTIVDYGAAIAVDAFGRRLAMPTQFENGEITLTVDGAWLESAMFPLTIDPLLSSVSIDTSNTDLLEGACLVKDTQSSEILVVLTRFISGSDTDIAGINYLSSFNAPVTVFLNSTEFTSLRNPAIAFVGGANRWITTFEAEIFGALAPHKIGYYTHASGSLVLGTQWLALPQGNTTSRKNPDVGGNRLGSTGTIVPIVCEQDNTTTSTSTSSTAIRIDRLNVVTNTIVATTYLTGGFIDRSHPTINQESAGGASPWILAWQWRDTFAGGSEWEILASRIPPSGAVTNALTRLGQATNNSRHNVAPQIAGCDGRYMVTYASLESSSPTTFTTGPELRATFFTWPDSAPGLDYGGDFQIRSNTTPMHNVDLAFDTTTDGHWVSLSHLQAILFVGRNITAQRLVQDGVVETMNQGAAGIDVATGYGVCYDSNLRRFPVFYTDPNNSRTRGTFVIHPVTPTPVVYGPTCGTGAPWNAVIDVSGITLSGNRNFRVRLQNGSATNVLLVSNSPAVLPLDFLGFNGCVANVDLGAGFIGSTPGIPMPGYNGTADIPIPGSFTGNVYFQWAFIAPGLNPEGLGFSEGLGVTVVQ